jgi:hypothetical protein
MLKADDERNRIYSSKQYQGFGRLGRHQLDRHRRGAVFGGVAIEANKG